MINDHFSTQKSGPKIHDHFYVFYSRYDFSYRDDKNKGPSFFIRSILHRKWTPEILVCVMNFEHMQKFDVLRKIIVAHVYVNVYICVHVYKS